jgi:hypothetical protein
VSQTGSLRQQLDQAKERALVLPDFDLAEDRRSVVGVGEEEVEGLKPKTLVEPMEGPESSVAPTRRRTTIRFCAAHR